jgi:asparagine synthase (glutamine-hydrolysing)
MCGIAGEFRFGAGSSGANWSEISAMMARRGPDDSGVWSEDNYCTLVFRRLSILDLSADGHQPMISHDRRYVLVFNGELYNFREIRRELSSAGVQFRSSGDTEVVLYALIKWGKSALQKFNGMFALAFYDSVERRMLLARDHAGIKPLYYMKKNEGVAFFSQYDQLLSHPWSKGLDVSQDGLGMYLRLSYIPAPYAILKSTYLLEPGAWLEINSKGNVSQGKYYEFPVYEKPVLSGHEAVEAVDAVLSESVKRQLISDVPVSAFLSGGIDSPLVVSKMAENMQARDISAFTIGTDGDKTDETEDAKRYAQELGVKHIIEQATPSQSLEMLDDVVKACGEPFGDFSMFPTMLVSRLASRDFKVILSGDGGDELFWGYASRSAPLISVAHSFSQPHLIRKAHWGLKKIFGIGAGRYDLRHYSNLGEWHRAMHTYPPESISSKIFPNFPAWPKEYGAFDYSGCDADETAQWLRWNEFVTHLTMVLMKVDRASMYHSLEVRVPLLDREVINVAAQIDWESCLSLDNMMGKLPLRQVLSKKIKHHTHGKRGFSVPMDVWLRTSLRPVFEELVLNRDAILGLEINRGEMRSLFDQHLGGADHSRGLWTILSLALWERQHYLGR